MATQAQIEANRRNSQKSTGPKTSEGKARVSLNALKHGIRARAMVDQLQRTPLWDEDPQEFAHLVQSLVDQFQPEGIYEEMCVEDIAINQQRLRRVARAEIGYIAGDQRRVLDGPGRDNPRLQARNALPDLDVLEKLNRYETSIRRQIDRAIDTLARLQASRTAQAPVEARDLAPLSTAHEGPITAQSPDKPSANVNDAQPSTDDDDSVPCCASPAITAETASSAEQSQRNPESPDVDKGYRMAYPCSVVKR